VATAPMVVIEAIKLLEAGLSRALCDQIWVTACRPEQQVERLARSRGMTAEQVVARQASQMPLAEMVTQAHRVIDTSGSLAGTGLQTLAAWCELGLPLPAPAVRAGQDEDAAGMAALVDAGPLQASVLGMARVSGPGHGERRAVVAAVAGVVLGYLALEPGPEPGGPATLAGAWLRSCPSTAAPALAARAVEQARQAGFAGLVARPEAGDAAALALLAAQGFQRRGPGEPEYELTW
jgi:hypothetical protein